MPSPMSHLKQLDGHFSHSNIQIFFICVTLRETKHNTGLVALVEGKRESHLAPLLAMSSVAVEYWHIIDTKCLYECILLLYMIGCG